MTTIIVATTTISYENNSTRALEMKENLNKKCLATMGS